jgi:hypothetical protein
MLLMDARRKSLSSCSEARWWLRSSASFTVASCFNPSAVCRSDRRLTGNGELTVEARERER